MDDVDAWIVEILAKNSRVSFRKIAKETGLSTDTVTRRYQKLEKEGVIHPTIKVDLAKLGYQADIWYVIKVVSQSSLPEIMKEVAKIPDVTAIIRATGAHDLLLIAHVRDFKHTFEIGESIKATKGVRTVAVGRFIPRCKFDEFDATFPPPIWHNLNTQTREYIEK